MAIHTRIRPTTQEEDEIAFNCMLMDLKAVSQGNMSNTLMNLARLGRGLF